MSFRDSHHICAKIVAMCMKKGISLDELSLEEYEKKSKLFDNDLYDKIDLVNCVENRKAIGGPNPREVLRQISYIEEMIEE